MVLESEIDEKNWGVALERMRQIEKKVDEINKKMDNKLVSVDKFESLEKIVSRHEKIFWTVGITIILAFLGALLGIVFVVPRFIY